MSHPNVPFSGPLECQDVDYADYTLSVEALQKRKEQNRLAQRKHRDKMKQRIRDLEMQLESAKSTAQSSRDEELAIQHQSESLESGSRRNSLFEPLDECAPPPTCSSSTVIGNVSEYATGNNLPTPRRFSESSIKLDNAFHHGPHSLVAIGVEANALIPLPGTKQGYLSGNDVEEWRNLERLIDAIHSNTPDRSPLAKAVEERVAWTAECVKQAGFKHIDEFFRIYYTESFDTLSSVHESQRVSRTRELAQTLQAMRVLSEQWPERESRPYRAEVFASAETLYTRELRKALDSGMLNLLCSGDQGVVGREALRQQKSGLQEQLPNLWGLLMELTSGSSVDEVRASFNIMLNILSMVGN